MWIRLPFSSDSAANKPFLTSEKWQNAYFTFRATHAMSALSVGVTGTMGSGKSHICKIFACLGTPVYNADNRAKHLIATDTALRESMKKTFDSDLFDLQGQFDRKAARSFFRAPAQLKKLNALVHPCVIKDYQRWRATHQRAPYTVKEAALLIEAGTVSQLDCLIVVIAPVDIRIRRVLKRDPWRTEEDVRHIMQQQLSEAEKMKRADHIIVNDDTRPTLPQVLTLHQQFFAARQKNAKKGNV